MLLVTISVSLPYLSSKNQLVLLGGHVRADESRGVQFEWLDVTGMCPK